MTKNNSSHIYEVVVMNNVDDEEASTYFFYHKEDAEDWKAEMETYGQCYIIDHEDGIEVNTGRMIY